MVVSVLGVIFAHDPAQALREIARILRPGGRALLTAWVPAGPIDAMLGAMGRIVGRATSAPPPKRTAWADPDVVAALADESGLVLEDTMRAELPIRAASLEAYIAAGQEHPMALATRLVIERAGVQDEVREAMTSVLQEANQAPGSFLVHSPYVGHELRAGERAHDG